jgi:hypothetical protein
MMYLLQQKTISSSKEKIENGGNFGRWGPTKTIHPT